MADSAASAEVKVAQMPEEMQEQAFKYAREALVKHSIEKDVAQFVKMKFDEEHKGTWHCIVGRNFGCSITHDTEFLVFFTIDQMNFLLFKSYE